MGNKQLIILCISGLILGIGTLVIAIYTYISELKGYRLKKFMFLSIVNVFIWTILIALECEAYKIVAYQKIIYPVKSVSLIYIEDTPYFEIDTGNETIYIRQYTKNYPYGGTNTSYEMGKYDDCLYIILYYDPATSNGLIYEDYNVKFINVPATNDAGKVP